eukprot:10693438-Lingulodinium_polyedra.AAC.1
MEHALLVRGPVRQPGHATATQHALRLLSNHGAGHENKATGRPGGSLGPWTCTGGSLADRAAPS